MYDKNGWFFASSWLAQKEIVDQVEKLAWLFDPGEMAPDSRSTTSFECCRP
jgi:hypothetical protein